jgi:alpha-methylacyl-CoA racemase
MDDEHEGAGPLGGVRILELAGIGPAQHGVMLLADLGADVIRVDRPAAGVGEPPRGGVLDRGRRSIALDLKDPDDVAALALLCEDADVLVDPYRPGVLERLGLAPAELRARNPRLVVARMTGWGQEGPLAHAAGHDLNYIALAGALETMGAAGELPPVPLNLVADFGGGGMLLAFGIAAALLERERSGEGQVLDVAMVDGVVSLLSGIMHLRGLGELRPGRGENWVQGGAPWYRPYRTADGGHVTVASLEEKFYIMLLGRLGLAPEDWPQNDRARWPELTVALEGIFSSRSLEEWRAVLEGTDVCFAPSLDLDAAARHPHMAARGSYLERDGVLEPAPVPRFDRTPGRAGRPAPWPGEHQDEVLSAPAGGRPGRPSPWRRDPR